MTLRQKLSKRPWLTGSVAGLFSVVAIYCTMRAKVKQDGVYRLNAFYSNDDGASLFPGEGDKADEMQHQHPPAYRAMVYSCDGGRLRFIAYFVQLPIDQLDHVRQMQDQLNKLMTKVATNDPQVVKLSDELSSAQAAVAEGTTIKAPGEHNQWLPANSTAGQKLMLQVTCPDGGSGPPEAVLP